MPSMMAILFWGGGGGGETRWCLVDVEGGSKLFTPYKTSPFAVISFYKFYLFI